MLTLRLIQALQTAVEFPENAHTRTGAAGKVVLHECYCLEEILGCYGSIYRKLEIQETHAGKK